MLACFLLVSLPLLLAIIAPALAPCLFSLASDSAPALLEPDPWNPTDRIGNIIYPSGGLTASRPVRAVAPLPTFPRPLSRDVVATVRALRSPVRTNRLAA
jgi:hypothetical protein